VERKCYSGTQCAEYKLIDKAFYTIPSNSENTVCNIYKGSINKYRESGYDRYFLLMLNTTDDKFLATVNTEIPEITVIY